MTPAPDQSATRKRIVRTAAELFAARGYHATGMKDLCDAVGLGRGALYHHIDGKEGLLYDISSEYMEKLRRHARVVADGDDTAVAKVTELSRFLMVTITEHLPELTVCFGEVRSLTGTRADEVMRLHQDYERCWQQVLREGVHAGQFRTADHIVLKGLLGMHFYSYLWLDPHGKQSPEQVAAVFTDISLRALASAQSVEAGNEQQRGVE